MDLIELSDFIKIHGISVWQIDTFGVLWLQPFSNNQDIHPSEQGKEEKESGNKFEEEIEPMAEVETVKSFHNDTD
jgi:hypothetical protein